MPQPPDIPDLDKLNFITGYFLQGCVPPFWLFIQCAKEPAGELAVTLFGFDLKDIIKEWLRPVRHRVRMPDRHGRKRWRWKWSLDPNEYVSTRIRARSKVYPGIDLPGSRAMFYLSDQADKIAITAAVLEGATDIGFEGLLGVITADPNNCPNLAFLHRIDDDALSIPGFLPPDQVISADTLLNAQHFQGDGPFAYTTYAGDWTLGWNATMVPYSLNGCVNWRAGIWSADRGLVAEGSPYTLPQGGVGHPSVSAELKAGEFAWPCRLCDSGSVELFGMSVFAFAGGLW